MAWFVVYGSHSYGFGSSLQVDLMVAGILSWIVLPLRLLVGLCSAGVSRLIQPKMHNKTLHPTAGNALV